MYVIISYQGAYIKEKLYKRVFESIFSTCVKSQEGFPGALDSKESAYNAGDPGSIPESGRCPGEGNGNPLQCSCLGNPRDRGAWWAAVCGVAQSRTRLKRLSSSSSSIVSRAAFKIYFVVL